MSENGEGQARFRDYQPGDEQQIVELLRASFGIFYPAEKPVDESDFIAWFAEPHESHRGWVAVGESNSRIVTVTARLQRDIRVGDRLIPGTAGGIASATHPDAQGQGLNLGLRAWMRSQEPPANASIERSRMLPRRGRGRLTLAAGFGVYLKVLRPWPGPGRRLSPRTLAYPALLAWGALRASTSRPTGDVVARTIPSFDGLDAFIEEASRGWDFIPERSVEYLNWRFGDPRAGRFIVRLAEQDGAPVGYAVLHRLGSRGHIADILALPGRADVARALIDDATGWFKRDGANALECWIHRRHPYARALRQAGFVILPRASREADSEISLFGRAMTAEERARVESPEARIHVVRADMDGI